MQINREVKNISMRFQDGSEINFGSGKARMSVAVKRLVVYGKHYALCPSCDEGLGGYYNDAIRKFSYCPYCGELIHFED